MQTDLWRCFSRVLLVLASCGTCVKQGKDGGAGAGVEHPGEVTLALRCCGVTVPITHPLCLQTHVVCDLPK